MKTKVFAGLMMMFAMSSILAQDNQMDSVLILQKQLMNLNQKIYGEVKYEDPLVGKYFGLEFNPAYFLLGGAGKNLVLSGTFSMFNVDRKAEVAIPLFYQKSNKNESRIFTADLVYRRFLGEHQNGFYLSGGARFANLKGEQENDGFFGYERTNTKTNKVGAMFGIGYRVFTKSGFYWGAGLSAGRYFTGKNKMYNVGIDGTKYILDVELLKFGVTF